MPDFHTQHALLLQGPVGPFFRHLCDELKQDNTTVTKINFSPGDDLFFRGDEVIRFRRSMDEWPQFFRSLIREKNIDAIFLFGDCRPMHKQAVRIAKERGIAVWVFEEGYLRPDYITIEYGGVNGNSSLPKDPDFYRTAARDLPVPPKPIPVGYTFAHAALYATINALALTLFWWRYPHYRHHRNINAWMQTFYWVRSFFRKLWYGTRERPLLERFQGEWSRQYFFVPLQVYCDAQLQHSPYDTVEEFIDDVISSFVENAPENALLVFKHHPHDRPYKDYGRYLKKLGRHYNCTHRLIYVHDLYLPTLLQHARAVITINSTVGTTALAYGAPVKTLGTAIYDLPELTFQGELADFFKHPGMVDRTLYNCFSLWLRTTNQVNGSFYKSIPGFPTAVRRRFPVLREHMTA